MSGGAEPREGLQFPPLFGTITHLPPTRHSQSFLLAEYPVPSPAAVSRLFALTALALVPSVLFAQPPKDKPPPVTVSPTEADEKIIAEVKDRSQVLKNLQHLCDVIGPRVTGSANLEKANRWAEKKMIEYGLTNVKLEPWEIPVAWERVTATLKLVEPNAGKQLTVASAAWAPGTKGKITAEVVAIEAKTKDDLAKYKGTLKGKVVLPRPPAEVKPVTDLASYLDRPRPAQPDPKATDPKGGQPKPADKGPSMEEMRAYQEALGEFLKGEQVAATLRDSNKPHGLLTMTGSWPRDERGEGSQTPSLFITHEHYSLLHRLATAKDGPKPTVELEVTNKFTPGPITVYNTVGEITGSEKPDEFVVVGAHLDSWDLGTGATDNGTGSCVVLEVARVLGAMAKAGIRPKRTVRFVLFTGEEQGLFGSKKYVERHKDEMPKTSAALVHDTGTGKVKGFGLQNREAVKKVLDPELESLKKVEGWTGLTLRKIGGTDHLSFEAKEVGVPGFACDQDPDEYYLTHHTQSDTFDHAKEPNLVQGAQAIAVTAFRIANLPDLLPRDRKEEPRRPGGGGGETPPGGETKPPEAKPGDPKKEEKK